MKRFRISRRTNAIIHIILLVVLAVAFYIAKGCPALTFRQEYRRAEKNQLIGPAKIVDRLTESDYFEYEDMLVAQTDSGVCFFGRDSYYRSSIFEQKDYHYTFTYREKAEDVTVLAAPHSWHSPWEVILTSFSLPVYIFTEYPDAAMANLTISISGVTEETKNEPSRSYSAEFRGKATVIKDGVLRCYIKGSGEENVFALSVLSEICGNDGFASDPAYEPTVLCTVWLLDKNEELIAKHTIQITQTDIIPQQP